MLKVETFKPGGRDPDSLEASRVLIRDQHGNPVVVAVTYADNCVLVSTCNDDDFQTVLDTLGVKASHVKKRITV